MENQQFKKIMDEELNYCKTLLQCKNVEYKGEVDRLHTFKTAAVMEGITPKQALAGMMAKHTISIYDMCREGDYSIERWTEKITDHINYLLLLQAMVVEEKEENHEL